MRRFFYCGLFILLVALTWKGALGTLLQGALRYKWGTQLAYRELRVEQGCIVLSDAVLFDATCHVRAERVELGLKSQIRLLPLAAVTYFAREIGWLELCLGRCFESHSMARAEPLELDARIVRPHVALLEGFSAKMSRIKASAGRWIDPTLTISDGTFEWRDGVEDPYFGHFSYTAAQGLQLKMGEGTLAAHLIRSGSERRIDCAFDQWEIEPLSAYFSPVKGKLSGSLHVALEERRLERLSGRCVLQDGAFSWPAWGEGSAAWLEWEGDLSAKSVEEREWVDALFGQSRCLPRRMRIECRGGALSRGGSRVEEIAGVFSCNRGAGLRWEVTGRGFQWEGKGFSQSCQANWIESEWRWGEAKGSVSLVEDEVLRGALVGVGVSADLIQLAEHLSPVAWPWQWQQGTVSGRVEWEKKDGSLLAWRVKDLAAEDVCLKGSDGWVSCHAVSGSAACRGKERSAVQASVSLSCGAGTWKKETFQDVQLHGQIVDGEILAGALAGVCNELAVEARATGHLHRIHIDAKAKGLWSRYLRHEMSNDEEVESVWRLEGDWNRFNVWGHATLAEGEILTGQLECAGGRLTKGFGALQKFQLARLRPWLDAEGLADATVSYEGGVLTLTGSAAPFRIATARGVLSTERLADVQVRWQDGWSGRTGRVKATCGFGADRIPFEGQFIWEGDALFLSMAEGRFADLEFAGEWEFSLQGEVPFYFVASELKGPLKTLVSRFGHVEDLAGSLWSDAFEMSGDLFDDPARWHWQGEALAADVQWGPLCKINAAVAIDSEIGLLECANLSGALSIGDASFNWSAAQLRLQGDAWRFDVRLEEPSRDLARLAGTVEKEGDFFSFHFEPAKSHLLGEPLEVEQFLVQTNGAVRVARFSHSVRWPALLAAAKPLQRIHPSFGPLLKEQVAGSCRIAVDYRRQGASRWLVSSENLHFRAEPLSLSLEAISSADRWLIERLCIGEWTATGEIAPHSGRSQGQIACGKTQLAFHGAFGPALKTEWEIDALSVDLNQVLGRFWPAVTGKAEGRGSLALEWKEGLFYEADLSLTASELKSGVYEIENPQPIQLHFSQRQGLLLRGLDLSVHKPDIEWPWLHGRIGLMQFDFARRHWILHHCQVSVPADSLAHLCHKFDSPLVQALDTTHELEFAADFDCAADFSSLTCSMREGFIPFCGAARHLQNLNFTWDPSRLSAEWQAIHQGHTLALAADFQFGPPASGRLTVQDQAHPLAEGERPLTILWEHDPVRGLAIHSLEGTCNGLEASFHAEKAGSLIGSARLHLGQLAEILPAPMAKGFRKLKMGKGYELKGRLLYDCDHPTAVGFKGLLSGKGCELFGFQLRTLLSQIELDSTCARLFEIKASDAAGILKIDELVMSQKAGEPWRISLPRLTLHEFRPSLLLRPGQEEMGPIAPLVVRELKMLDFVGQLDDSLTYRATGQLHFINSFKREHTVFDLPADFLGRIFGLDLELLIPVQGRLTFTLEEGRFWLEDLQDAYSEGQRSKFSFVTEGLSPTIDLDGNLNILIKMKQYVLFKITENFLLSIDGSLENPSYHLQKKSKILGL